MTAPSTYYEWANLLDKFGDGDDATLEELSKGSFTVEAGTATRFYLRVEEAYKKRKQNWLDKFQRSFRMQSFKTVGDIEIALRNSKKNLYLLSKFVAIKVFPEDLQKILKKDLDTFVAEIKKSLKENISKTSVDREKMLILLNTFGLNNIPEEIKTDKQSKNEIISPTGRKIIL